MSINGIGSKTCLMADTVCNIVSLVDKAFMEHKTDILNMAMAEEGRLNGMEKALTNEIRELYKIAEDDGRRNILSAFQQAVETLERMGDEAANLMERIEIKITEHLLFSEEGVAQFNEIYGSMNKSVVMMREFLQDKKPGMKDRIIDNGFRVKSLVERARKEHSDRLLKGLCTPMGANMYFDMLDFTGNLARHASNIVKLF